jgi:hypothetical protein
VRLFDSIGRKGIRKRERVDGCLRHLPPQDSGKWHIRVSSDKETADPPKCEGEPIDIDRGIEVFAALSTEN